jgi:formylmethanofuran dehydrogenase subunit E
VYSPEVSTIAIACGWSWACVKIGSIFFFAIERKKEARSKRRETRTKSREPRDKKRETRSKSQEARAKSREKIELFAVRFLCVSAPLRAKRRKNQETRAEKR